MNKPPEFNEPMKKKLELDRYYLMNDYSEIKSKLNIIEYLELVLKKPGKLFYEINTRPSINHFLILLVLATLFLLGYGLVLGTFSGNSQLYIAPLKITVGLYLSAIICLPSLYIFSCLGKARIGFISVLGNLLITLTLLSILLIGFAPVVWIFSQSTNTISFIGFIHLLIYSITVVFSFKLLWEAIHTVSTDKNPFINVWMIVFVVVSLQMSTALRPIIGSSDTLLPSEKKFFLTHWSDVMMEKADNNRERKN